MKNLKKFVLQLKKKLPTLIDHIEIDNTNTPILYIKKENLLPILTFCKNHTKTKATVLTEITAIDYHYKKKRFQLNYIILSLVYSTHFRIKFEINEWEKVPSCVSMFKNALWLERETWDMFGVHFENNPDLRRILTDYGFEGHPLRKDFPLTGFYELRYDETQKRIVSEKVELAQEFRTYNFNNTW